MTACNLTSVMVIHVYSNIPFVTATFMCIYIHIKHTHQFRGQFLKMCCALFHILLGPPESDDILLIPRLRKGHLDPVETITDLSNFLPLCPDDLLVEALLDNDIFGALIFLRNEHVM